VAKNIRNKDVQLDAVMGPALSERFGSKFVSGLRGRTASKYQAEKSQSKIGNVIRIATHVTCRSLRARVAGTLEPMFTAYWRMP
jgi:hypothetical protein